MPRLQVMPANYDARDHKIDFETIGKNALSSSSVIVASLLPDGRREGQEWVSRNPNRADRSPGSFKINLRNGKWADFATEQRGNDLISLVSYLKELPPKKAALWLRSFMEGGCQ